MKDSEMSIYERDLDQTPANHVPLSPVSFLLRAARVYPNRVAVIQKYPSGMPTITISYPNRLITLKNDDAKYSRGTL